MNASRKIICALVGPALVLAASAGRMPGQGCDPCGVPCEPATCTVLMPQVVTEYQARTIVRYRPEVRQRMVTVYRDVPAVKTVQEEYTVMVPRTETRKVVDTINHPVWGDIQLRAVSMTPEIEPRQATYTVTQMVPVQEERTECNPCAPQKIRATTWKPVDREEKVQYPLTHFQPNARTRNVAFYEFQPEKKVRTETYVVQVPEIRTRPRQITVMRPVAEQRPEQYTVMVPYEEHIQVPVVTRRYVEQTIYVR